MRVYYTYLRYAIKAMFMSAVLLNLLALSLHAQTIEEGTDSDQKVISKITVEEMRDILLSEGYGDVVIKGEKEKNIVFKTEGIKVAVFFGAKGTSIQLDIFWGVTEDLNKDVIRCNEWNRKWKYSKAYIDKDGYKVLELDLDLSKGVTIGRIKDYLQTGKLSINNYIELFSKQ